MINISETNMSVLETLKYLLTTDDVLCKHTYSNSNYCRSNQVNVCIPDTNIVYRFIERDFYTIDLIVSNKTDIKKIKHDDINATITKIKKQLQ